MLPPFVLIVKVLVRFNKAISSNIKEAQFSGVLTQSCGGQLLKSRLSPTVNHDVTHWFLDIRFKASSLALWMLVIQSQKLPHLDETVELDGNTLGVGFDSEAKQHI